jgi:hypothetical protein
MPAALNEWPTGPSAAADFCNKIGPKRTSRSPPEMSVVGGRADVTTDLSQVRLGPEGDVKAPRCRLGTHRGAALAGVFAGTGFTTP